jgi:hypothetical protein
MNGLKKALIVSREVAGEVPGVLATKDEPKHLDEKKECILNKFRAVLLETYT